MLDGILEFFIGIFLTMDSFFYSLVGFFYEIFILLAGAELFTSDVLGSLTQRIYIIVGVFMLFMLAYSLLTTLINPENMAKGKSAPGNVLKSVVISISFLVFTPALFNFMYTVQNVVITDNLIGDVIFGGFTGSSPEYVENANSVTGRLISNDIFTAFFQPSVGYSADQIIGEMPDGNEVVLSGAKDYILNSNGYPFDYYKFFAGNVVDGEITYIFFISAIFSFVALYLFASFALDMAVRIFKLAYFQIIAPIPIIYNVVPGGEKVFQTWLKKTLSTFVEVFIRIFVVYFLAFAMSLLPAASSGFFSDLGGNFWLGLLARVVIILGLVLFAKSAPKLISETFGLSSGNLDLGIKKFQEGVTIPGTSGLSAYIKGAHHGYNDNKEGTPVGKRLMRAASTANRAGLRGFFGSLNAKTPGDLKKAHTNSVAAADAIREKKDARKKQRDEFRRQRDEEISAAEAHNAKNPNDLKAVPNKMGGAAAYMTQLGRDYKKWAGADVGAKVKTDKLEGRQKLVGEMEAIVNGAKAKYSNDSDQYEKYKDASHIDKSNGYETEVNFLLENFSNLESASKYVESVSADTKVVDSKIENLIKSSSDSDSRVAALSDKYNAKDTADKCGVEIKDYNDKISNNNKTITDYQSKIASGNISPEDVADLQAKIKNLSDENTSYVTKRNDATTKMSHYNKVAASLSIVDRANIKTQLDAALVEQSTVHDQLSALEKTKQEILRDTAAKKQAYSQAMFFIEKQIKNDIADVMISGKYTGNQKKIYGKESGAITRKYREVEIYDDDNSYLYPEEVLYGEALKKSGAIYKALDDGKVHISNKIQDIKNTEGKMMELDNKMNNNSNK